jgi:isopentenyl diphosphate isomerase/L-lactate dehydrogenase-like FMN-dependent dehydrogenase
MPVITNIEDLRVLARKRVPRMFYDYADSGSWTESTYRANEADFQAIKLRQRVAVNMENRSLRTTMAGEDVAMPVALAPTGLTGMQHADGEILAARAAEAFGVPFTLSTMSICSIEDVAARTTRPFWLQLYVMRDRAFIERLIDRAKAARCSALMLTLDLQILGQRHKDLKNGLSAPPKPTLANLINLATKPRWCWHMMHTPQLRQHRGPRVRRGRPLVAQFVDGRAVRSGPELGRCRMDQEALGRQADPEGHPRRGRRPAGRQQRRRRPHRVEPRRAAARRRDVVDRGAARHRRGRGP